MSVMQGAAWVVGIVGLVVGGWLATPRPEVIKASCACGSREAHERAARVLR